MRAAAVRTASADAQHTTEPASCAPRSKRTEACQPADPPAHARIPLAKNAPGKGSQTPSHAKQCVAAAADRGHMHSACTAARAWPWCMHTAKSNN